MLFALIIDRETLSQRNSERFTDSDGSVFVFFTIKEISRMLGCGNKKAVSVLMELEKKNLVEKRRTGQGHPTRIKVTQFAADMIKSECGTNNSEDVRTVSENYHNDSSGCVGMTVHDLSERQGSNNNMNNTDMSKTDPSIIYEKTVAEIEEQIEMDCINGDKEIVRELVLIMADVMTMPSPTVKISGVALPQSVVAERFRLIRAEHIENIVFDISRCGKKILNMRSYLIATLYNAPTVFAVTEAAEYAYHNRDI